MSSRRTLYFYAAAFAGLALFLIGAAQSQPLAEAVARGKAVFEANCQNCHGANGLGAAPGVPALDGSAVVKFDTARQLRTVLDGTPRGMPPWAKLSDKEIADVVTFSKNQWSNQTGVIMAPSLVGLARSRGDGCVDQFFSPLPPPTGSGRVHDVITTAGSVRVWWCMLPVRQGDVANKLYWRMQGYPVHNEDASRIVLAAAAARVAAAAVTGDPIAQAWAEVRNAQITLVPGSKKEYEYKTLAWLGCEKLRITPPPGEPFDTPLAADHCGPAPVAPAPPPPIPTTKQYIVTGTAAYPATHNGTAWVRGTTALAAKGVIGEPGSGDVLITQFGALFCKNPRLSTASVTTLSGCKVK